MSLSNRPSYSPAARVLPQPPTNLIGAFCECGLLLSKLRAVMREAWVPLEPEFLSRSVCAARGDPSAVPHGSTSGVFRNRSLFTLKLDVVAVFSAATSLVRSP
ncbi:hypothetical protein HPB50_006246 [Hyalomma asiaticum]|uniref:Uncharacterized protein n=1 Tax=Hyalomma asiaticum TaxID=266040 RepID=A0ACB7TD51_HYAAI|nr:hypothetical protein HPB50_006246 [Hyalomma asiaticum]